jgi:uncharacterized membrane protein
VFLVAFAQDPLANSIAVAVLLLMIASVISITYYFIKGKADSRLFRWPRLSIPILSIIGLGVALYLSYVEISKSQALCGPIGDCGKVQASAFAYLFGVIPIGVMGAAGYIAIMITWLLREFGPKSIQKPATLGLWAMAWFGMAFSIYLTFLEPFVIGATCAWCITSALVMMMVFWTTSGPAITLLSAGTDSTTDLDDEDDNTQAQG